MTLESQDSRGAERVRAGDNGAGNNGAGNNGAGAGDKGAGVEDIRAGDMGAGAGDNDAGGVGRRNTRAGSPARAANDTEFLRAARRSRELVLLRYFDPDGRLITMPAKQSRKLAVLDIVAGRFIPGVHYTETEVNRELIGIHQDYVTLRRALIDFGLMDRAGGQYWRSGGSVEV